MSNPIHSPTAAELAERRAADRARVTAMARPGYGRDQLAAAQEQQNAANRAEVSMTEKNDAAAR